MFSDGLVDLANIGVITNRYKTTWNGRIVTSFAVGTKKLYDFIDAMLAPESGKYMIEEYGYGHSNSKSFDLAAPDKVKALGFENPSQFLETGHFFQAVPPAKRQKLLELWQKIRAS